MASSREYPFTAVFTFAACEGRFSFDFFLFVFIGLQSFPRKSRVECSTHDFPPNGAITELYEATAQLFASGEDCDGGDREHRGFHCPGLLRSCLGDQAFDRTLIMRRIVVVVRPFLRIAFSCGPPSSSFAFFGRDNGVNLFEGI